MDKYALLVVLNLPFVVFGYIKTAMMLHTGAIRRFGFVIRALFWTVILAGLLFARQLYDFLAREGLSDTSPLSIADVVLVTGFIFCLSYLLTVSRVDQIVFFQENLLVNIRA